MLSSTVLSLLLLAACPATTAKKTESGCDALKHAFSDKTFYPKDAVYELESQDFWSNNEILEPACVFRPTSAKHVAEAVKLMSTGRTSFGLRGGGHMAIAGANNIDGGPLFVMSNLTTLELAKDKKSVWVGPGLDWGQVYRYLGHHKLAVAGGRLSPVGVPGLLLAGGINFHGNQRGWAADNVLEYELVVSSGKIISVTSKSHPDLFWALKGGSNNFGIVTKFKLATFTSDQIYAGIYSVADIPGFLKAVANFSAFNTDPLAHIVPQVIAVDEETTIGGAILFYDSDSNPEPECFRPFFDLPAISNTFEKKTLAQFSDETGQLVTPKINDQFIAGTTTGKTYEEILKGIQIVNNGFLNALQTVCASKKYNPGGNALGLDVEKKGTYIAWAEVVEWSGDEHNDAVFKWIEDTTWAIANATQKAGIYDPFTYMGDAAGFQNIYDGYGKENKQKLLQISRKYDPSRTFQKYWPGGFKIGL
ncbi:6-hydroxy-D-nicotine oxidase [Fusarium oxysporum f. sp. cubense race 1]|uniref:6-hydroxy-D-nicotine oxidase n=1 Tax=Fusarium oxysporum f. sp. cubense (strain race 1) TaxID=1229664 RepID=N4TS68_FUSC1|nr:6-hydroxy-D-nicotine oxidase [Fusarium oxysporum f. sp. cubense race 1]